MSEQTRKIRLKAGEPAQENWFNGRVVASPGEIVETGIETARLAVSSGKFDHIDEETAQLDESARSSPQTGASADALPMDFPEAEKLTAQGIRTLTELNGATDETLSAIEGIGAKTVAKIRQAAIDAAK